MSGLRLELVSDAIGIPVPGTESPILNSNHQNHSSPVSRSSTVSSFGCSAVKFLKCRCDKTAEAADDVKVNSPTEVASFPGLQYGNLFF